MSDYKDILFAMNWARFLILIGWCVGLLINRLTAKQTTMFFVSLLIVINVIGLALATWARMTGHAG